MEFIGKVESVGVLTERSYVKDGEQRCICSRVVVLSHGSDRIMCEALQETARGLTQDLVGSYVVASVKVSVGKYTDKENKEREYQRIQIMQLSRL